jgi:hypothetical protein
MLLSHDAFLRLPIIALKGLEGQPPADYSAFQIFLLPYVDRLQTFWWLCFAAVLAVLLSRYFILPLATRRRTGIDLPCPPFTTGDAPPETAGKGRSLPARLKRFYVKLFSLGEVEHDVALRLYGGAILIGYLATFRFWQTGTDTTIDAARPLYHGICWPFFQSCGDWLWLRTLPYGYSQTTLYMALFGVMLLAAYGLMVRRVVLAHACMLALFVCRMYLMLLTLDHNANFDYYHTLFNIVFLFLPQKRFFGSLVLVWCYFLSTAAKIHPSWVWGGYFSSLQQGLPLTPRGMEPFFTNFIIGMEMVASWFLFSRHKGLQRSVFAFFVFFHLYSGILVGYHYPTIVLPPLLIFFGQLYRPFPGVPLSRKAIPGWILIASLLVIQLSGHAYSGDTKLTLQGDYYGLYMFEANHECRETLADERGNPIAINDHVNARFRCDPWTGMTVAQQRYCASDPKPKIRFTMIHSINGGPFYKIVDEADLCSLRYKPFAANAWIKDETTAPMVGRPLKNYYQ